MKILLCLLLAIMPLHGSEFSFEEIWAYVYKSREKLVEGKTAITDLAYFSAEVNEFGKLGPVPDINKIPLNFRKGRRIHLVISVPGNRSLMHWVLTRDAGAKEELLSQIVKASAPFQGVQIDFEVIHADDRTSFWAFLKELKSRLPKGKMLSLAVLPRLRETQDAFNYRELASIPDRIIVMAYDEHWRTSAPGPIASLAWCEKVKNYAQSVIPREKLIFGIPTYGRLWQKQEAATLKYPQTLELWKRHRPRLSRTADGTPYFSFQSEGEVTVYYEDEKSLLGKLRLYAESTMKGVAFWQLGHEPAALWKHLN